MLASSAAESWPRSTTLTSVGPLMYIIVGAITGWVAGTIIKTKDGILLDVVVGILGSLLGGFPLLSFIVDTNSGGWWFTLLTAIVGAVIVIGLQRWVRRE
jgi:uncharacterized membrane protein YeaQ/YmgE (transglycosylase-associated protein family)